MIDLIKNYYEARGLKWPDVNTALMFVQTELAEVYELLISREGGFVRNHPEDKPKFNSDLLAEELGDALMMILVAGIVEGVDPIEALKAKINRKLESLKNAPKGDLESPNILPAKTQTVWVQASFITE